MTRALTSELREIRESHRSLTQGLREIRAALESGEPPAAVESEVAAHRAADVLGVLL